MQLVIPTYMRNDGIPKSKNSVPVRCALAQSKAYVLNKSV